MMHNLYQPHLKDVTVFAGHMPALARTQFYFDLSRGYPIIIYNWNSYSFSY